MAERVCAITGVGPGNGLALARRFAGAGYRVAMLARSGEALAGFEREVAGARGYAADVADPEVGAVYARIAEEMGPIEVLIHNAGSGVFGDFLSVEPADFEAAWRTNAMGLYLAARAVAPAMIEAGRGAIVVTGATAARKGRPNFAAFASAKAAQRMLAEALARQLGPEGVHVAYVVVDGVVDMPRTRAMMPEKPDEFFLSPDDIAATVQHLVEQPRSAWTFELELRPFGESW